MNKLNQLTSFDQAKLLKELGFEERTPYYFHDGISGIKELFGANGNYNCMVSIFSCPTISHALDWCREVKGVYAEIVLEIAGNGYYFILYRTDIGLHLSEPRSFNSYDECQSAALDAALEYIKQQKT